MYCCTKKTKLCKMFIMKVYMYVTILNGCVVGIGLLLFVLKISPILTEGIRVKILGIQTVFFFSSFVYLYNLHCR